MCSGATFLCGLMSTPLHQCFDAADCKMATEMRTRIEATQDPIVTFMHQMIPHHANAINMAKSLLKLHDERVADDEIGILLYSMINWQTLQMRFMGRLPGGCRGSQPCCSSVMPTCCAGSGPGPGPALAVIASGLKRFIGGDGTGTRTRTRTRNRICNRTRASRKCGLAWPWCRWRCCPRRGVVAVSAGRPGARA